MRRESQILDSGVRRCPLVPRGPDAMRMRPPARGRGVDRAKQSQFVPDRFHGKYQSGKALWRVQLMRSLREQSQFPRPSVAPRGRRLDGVGVPT